ncbi:hypothetical protein KIN20_034343 [Parelaphostrongylus tenuis]|uniref:Uncharacterized protein n=1 Tax=Parelaphostrongylus tenuis TaxID=148309 RepID=A0AAD5RA73_PARTN|nr:hypothetical protein KIN20_034343 [Parelaphostrongylus tenuis]
MLLVGQLIAQITKGVSLDGNRRLEHTQAGIPADLSAVLVLRPKHNRVHVATVTTFLPFHCMLIGNEE